MQWKPHIKGSTRTWDEDSLSTTCHYFGMLLENAKKGEETVGEEMLCTIL